MPLQSRSLHDDPDMNDLAQLNLVGWSAGFSRCLDLIQRFATCDATVLIQGETGTGKELAARGIHYLGQRREFPFIPVNCGAIPDNLVENELFGHARGAYTDASEARSGVIADAEGGTLFLDEVETLNARGQVALLRFLQDQHYRPLGGKHMMVANLRVIAASNVKLPELVRRGQFRQDLLFRLNIMGLEMPPLRARQGDVAALASHFLRRFSRQYGRSEKRLSCASLELLERYGWPGNVRELENLMHREFLLARGDEIEVDASGLDQNQLATGAGLLALNGFDGFRAAKAKAIAEFERNYLAQLLAETHGNVSLAARRCGKERRSLGKLLKKHGIDKSRYGRDDA
jgi:DNA-binding NtrC family response regulator